MLHALPPVQTIRIEAQQKIPNNSRFLSEGYNYIHKRTTSICLILPFYKCDDLVTKHVENLASNSQKWWRRVIWQWSLSAP